MRFAMNLLRINSVLFIVFGGCFVAAPEIFAAALTGTGPATPDALIDMRATYGGMALGIGLVFWFFARQRETVYAGLVGSVLVLGATALARAVGFVVDGAPNASMLLLFAAELLFMMLSFSALKRVID